MIYYLARVGPGVLPPPHHGGFIYYIVILYLPFSHTLLSVYPLLRVDLDLDLDLVVDYWDFWSLPLFYGFIMITTPLSLHVSDKQDSNLHHRPPRERTSPFGHYLHCTSFTVPRTPIHWTTVTPPCWLLLLLHSSLFSIYLPLFIYSFILRYPLFISFTLYSSILSLFTLSLPLF